MENSPDKKTQQIEVTELLFQTASPYKLHCEDRKTIVNISSISRVVTYATGTKIFFNNGEKITVREAKRDIDKYMENPLKEV